MAVSGEFNPVGHAWPGAREGKAEAAHEPRARQRELPCEMRSIEHEAARHA